MKRILAICLAALLLCGCAARRYEGPTEAETVLRETCQEHYWDTGEPSTTTRTVYIYDTYGNNIQTLESTDGEETDKTIYTYDERGNILTAVTYHLTGWFPKVISEAEYTYDDQGRIISEVHGSPDYKWHYTYAYDDEADTLIITLEGGAVTVQQFSELGYLVRSETTEPDGVTRAEEYTRRPDGQPLSLRSYRDGALESTLEYEYDDQGRILRLTTTEDGETAVTFRYEYDDQKHTETMYQEDGSYVVIRYNADGSRQVRESYGMDGTLQSRTTYLYREIQVPVS